MGTDPRQAADKPASIKIFFASTVNLQPDNQPMDNRVLTVVLYPYQFTAIARRNLLYIDTFTSNALCILSCLLLAS